MEEEVDDERIDYFKLDEPEFEFEAEDHNMKSGFVGFFSNGSGGAYFDQFYIEPIDCTDKNQKPHEYKWVPEECNRFRETYKGGPVELRWEQLDPEEPEDGPGQWKVEKNKYGRSKVLMQSTKIYSKSTNQDGSRVSLVDRECNDGHISFHFMALDKGVVKFMFRYVDATEYYCIEFKPDGAYLMRALGGTYMEITKDSGVMLEKEIWYKFKMQIKDVEAKFEFRQQGETEAFNLFDEGIEFEDITDGSIAFETFKCRALFDEIRLAPQDDIDLEQCWASGDPLCGNMEDYIDADEYSLLAEGEEASDILKQCIEDHSYEHRVMWCDEEFEE